MENPRKALYRFLDTNGDGTGTKNANGNYSVTPEEFYFEAERDCKIERMIVNISDTTGIQSQDYGNITDGLNNGFTIKVKDRTPADVVDLCDGVVISTNGDWGRHCYDVVLTSWGAGDEYVQVRWTFSKAGSPIFLRDGYRISITFNDDLSGLIGHYFMLQGYKV